MIQVFSFKHGYDCPVDRFVSCRVRPMEKYFKGKIWVPLGGYSSSFFVLLPYTSLYNRYITHIYRWYALIYISGTLPSLPNLSILNIESYR